MIKIATVFSGIGAAEHALEKINKEYKVVFASDNGERELPDFSNQIILKSINSKSKNIQKIVKNEYEKLKQPNYVKRSYFANYNIDEKDWHDDVRFINGKKYKGEIDILVGGSPCQSFSIIGKKAGLNDARGTLFYDYARLIKESKPKVFIFENVEGLMIHDKGNTWKIIKDIFDSLNYKIFYKVINAKDFNVPQNRKRIFVIGFKNKNVSFNFPKEQALTSKSENFLSKKVDEKYFLGEKGFKFVTNPKYKNRAQILNGIARAQKANQQFNWNGDFVFVPRKEVNLHNNSKAYLGKLDNVEGYIRKLTPREVLSLMGFEKSFKIVNDDVVMYRQSGNSIVVNVLEELLKEILKVL